MAVEGSPAVRGNSRPGTRGAPRLAWVVAAFGVVGPLAVGALNLLGVVSGLVVNVLGVGLLVTGFVGGISQAFAGQLRESSRRTKAVFVVAVATAGALLTGAGIGTRALAPLPRMGGTMDVAVVGYLAPTPDQQNKYDDVADSLAEALRGAGKARDYARRVDPPLDELAALGTTGDTHELDHWLKDFLAQTDAELVVAGDAQDLGAGQTQVHTYVYVPPELAADAWDLAGWYDLGTSLADRSLDSPRALRALLDRIVGNLDGMRDFLSGLDQWQAGYPMEAMESFTALLDRAEGGVGASGGSTLTDLAHLFRGHARASASALQETPAREAQLLSRAHEDYLAIPDSSPIAARARESEASNAYLQVTVAGCHAVNPELAGLAASAAALRAMADDASLPEVLRRTALVNLAQVEGCQVLAGKSEVDADLDRRLAAVVNAPIDADDLYAATYRQIRALGLSAQATREAGLGNNDEAVNLMEQAIDLEPRFERRAVWLGLESFWLLRDCANLDRGEETQLRALQQVDAAIDNGRLPASTHHKYTTAFAIDLDSARTRCAAS